MVAIIPIIIAIIALAGFIYGGLNPAIRKSLFNTFKVSSRHHYHHKKLLGWHSIPSTRMQVFWHSSPS